MEEGSRREAEMEPLRAPPTIDEELRLLVGMLKWVTGPEKLVLGGGGLLEALWGHRRSTDIDLFVEEREEMNVARDMVRNREEMEKSLARLNRIGEAFAEGKEAKGALLRGHVHGVPFSVYGSTMLWERRNNRRRVQGLKARWATVAEVLAGKVADRWVKDLRDTGRQGGGGHAWTPLVRDLYDVAVARARAAPALEEAVRRVPEEDRAALGRGLKQVTNEALERDTKRIMKAKYSANLARVAHEMGDAVERRTAEGITPAQGKDGKRKARERGG